MCSYVPPFIADTRVEKGVQHVGNKGRKNKNEGDKKYAGLNKRNIPRFDGRHGERPQAGKTEQGLHYDQTAEEPAHIHSDNSYSWKKCIFKGMAKNNIPARHSLEDCRSDIVRFHDTYHRGSLHARNISEHYEGDGEGRQNKDV